MSECLPTEASDFPRALLDAQRALVRKGVVWLNANRHRDDSHVVERWLTREIATLDEACKLLASGPRAGDKGENVEEWLETAGRVGGPEVEQDPTLWHPHAWHGHSAEADEPDTEQEDEP
jgi:hypothetical protein